MLPSVVVELQRSLARSEALFEVDGPCALRSQAQQQAALELMQARRLGADDAQLEAVLIRRLRASVAALLRDPGWAPGYARLHPPLPGAGVEWRVSHFLQAEAAQVLPPGQEPAA